MENKFEILYKKDYVGRIIFVIKYQNKITFVYKSSGLSGTGHKNDIIPFIYLNSRVAINQPILGYINKYYFKDGKITQHYKTFFGKEKEFLEDLKLFLKDEVNNETSEDITELINSNKFKDVVNEINGELLKLSKEYEFLDYNNIKGYNEHDG